jgi:hypothetical protein
MRDILGEIMGIVFIVVLCVVFCLVISTLITDHDDKLWNGGHCTCGGNWEYEQAVGHRTSTTYIYICDGCGKRIEISEMR